MNVLAKSGVSLGEIAFLAHGTTLVINALAERKGVEDGADHDRGLPRLARDRAGQPARLLQLALREAAAVRAALPPARGAGTTRTDGRGAPAARPLRPARDPRRLPRGRRRGGRDLPAPLLREPRARAGRARARARALAGGVRRRVAPDQPRVARVRADEHRRPLGLRPAGGRALPRPARRGARARRLRRAALRHAVELWRRLGREDEGDPDHDGRVGAGERLLGRGRARPAARRRERARARHRRDDGQVLAHRGRAREDHLRLLDRAGPPLGGLPDPGAGRRRGRDRPGRRQHRLGRRVRAAARRPAVGRGDARPGRVRPRRRQRDDDRRQPRARPHQRELLLRRRDRGRHGRGRPHARRDRGAARRRPHRGGARRRAHRQQQHDQRAEARLREPRLRPARLHARRLRRRWRHARRRARGRARDPEGGDPAGRRRLLGLGDADERPPPRLLRHPPDDDDRRERAAARRAARRDDADGARPVRARGHRPGAGAFRPLREPPLREPGAQRRGAAPRRRGRRGCDRADRRQLPRLVRARVHVSPRRAGRVRRRARRRDRRGGQAHAHAAAGDRAVARRRAQGPAPGRLRDRRRARGGHLRR